MTGWTETTLRRSAWAATGVVALVMSARVVVVATDLSRGVTDVSGAVGEAGGYLMLAGFLVAALVILRRQPGNRIGWLLMAIVLVWAVGMAADSYVRYGLISSPGSLPGPGVVAVVNAVIWAPGIGLMGTYLVLLFPDGRLPSRRWRTLGWLSGATIGALTVTLLLTPGELGVGQVPALKNPLGLESARPVLAPVLVALLFLFPCVIVASVVALALRFRRSTGIERLQLKWLAAAATVVGVLYLGSMLASLVDGALTSDGPEPGWLTVLDSLSFLAFLLLPVAIGVAVLRHRLYEVDLIINRTLVYATLSLTLAATYAGVVLLLQLLLNPLAHQSDLAVAGSTLAVAALFRPARARIQTAVDRRFYRSRYDAARTVGAFASRLRRELDLEAVGTDLRSTVDETVHPAHVSLWLRP